MRLHIGVAGAGAVLLLLLPAAAPAVPAARMPETVRLREKSGAKLW